MKTSVKMVLDKRKALKDDTYSISLRLVHKQSSTYIALGYSVHLKDWDPDNNIILKSCRKYSNLVRINNTLSAKLVTAQDIIEKLTYSGEIETMSPTDIKARILNQSAKITFAEYTDKIVADLKSSKNLGNASCYTQAKDFLVRHLGTANLSFEEINYKALKTLETRHLAGDNSLNSLSFYLRTIRAIYNRAIKEGIVSRDYYPFTHYSIKETKTQKRAISRKDIEKIRDAVFPERTPIWHARNYFLFSFYNIGMNFADMAFLKKSNIVNNRIQYTRAKTGKFYSVKIEKPTRDILDLYISPKGPDDYIFPIITRTKLEDQIKDEQNGRSNYNKYLKKIAAQLGIEANLTSYVARHSWATIAKGLNVPISVISEGLGHEDIKTTQIYLDSFDDDVIDSANRLVMG